MQRIVHLVSAVFFIILSTHYNNDKGSAFVSAQITPCTICKNGEAITSPDAPLNIPTLPFVQNCGGLSLFLPAIQLGSAECDIIQSLSSLCGCPTEPDACHLCGNPSSTVGFPQKQIPSLSALLPVAGIIPTCELAQAYLRSFPQTDSLCSIAQDFVATYCACYDTAVTPTVPPSATAAAANVAAQPRCTLCPLGDRPTNTTKPLAPILPDFPFDTCSDLDAVVRELVPRSHTWCSYINALGHYCGCRPNPYVREGGCSVCWDGREEVPNPSHPVPDLSNLLFGGGSGSASAIIPTCGLVQSYALSSNYALDCQTVQGLGYECGCPAVEQHCDLCYTGEQVPEEYLDVVPPGPTGRDGVFTCRLLNSYSKSLTKTENNHQCLLIRATTHWCGCNGGEPAYLGADTMPKKRGLAFLQIMTGVLSLAASLAIIVDILSSPLKRNSMFTQLIMGMSCYDCVSSVSWVISPFTMVDDQDIYNVDTYLAQGTEQSCQIQAFALQFGFASVWYNLALALYYRLCILHGWREQHFRTFLRAAIHVLILGVAIGLAVYGWDFYEPMIFTCYFLPFSVEPNNTTRTFLMALMPLYVIGLVLLIISSIYLQIMLCRPKTAKMEKSTALASADDEKDEDGVMPPNAAGIIKAEEEDEGGIGNGDADEFAGDTEAGTEVIATNLDEIEISSIDPTAAVKDKPSIQLDGAGADFDRDDLERKVFRQCLWYCGSFAVTWICISVAFLWPDGLESYPLWLANSIFSPFQGLLNASIHFRHNIIELVRNNRCCRYLCCCRREFEGDEEKKKATPYVDPSILIAQ